MEAGFTAVESPVAGSLWKHEVAPGTWVEAGEPVALVESMKTEIAVLAPEAGRLSSFAVEPGTPVTPGSTIALLGALNLKERDASPPSSVRFGPV